MNKLTIKTTTFTKDVDSDLKIEVYKAYMKNLITYLNQDQVEELFEFLKTNFIEVETCLFCNKKITTNDVYLIENGFCSETCKIDYETEHIEAIDEE